MGELRVSRAHVVDGCHLTCIRRCVTSLGCEAPRKLCLLCCLSEMGRVQYQMQYNSQSRQRSPWIHSQDQHRIIIILLRCASLRAGNIIQLIFVDCKVSSFMKSSVCLHAQFYCLICGGDFCKLNPADSSLLASEALTWSSHLTCRWLTLC